MKLPRVNLESPVLHRLAALSVFAIVGTGTYWALTRGGKDFDVFYQAFHLALSGWGMEMYRVSPDRFLYAPGFAYLFAPIALLQRDVGLLLWCLLKGLMLFVFLGKFARKLPRIDRVPSALVPLLAVVLVAKPLLIDFRYGQINLFLVTLAGWALLSHFDRGDAVWRDFVKWFFLAIAAVTKLFLVPVLVVPWFLRRGVVRKRLLAERLAVLSGVGLTLALPFAVEGVRGGADLYVQWRQAVIARGVPSDSHNQSFGALLHHYMSGQPTQVLSVGTPIQFGVPLLDSTRIAWLTLAWTCILGGLLAGWLVTADGRPPLTWLAVLLGLLIVPSHLVWKPYFVFSLPLAVLYVRETVLARAMWRGLMPVALFGLINLTGFDFVGPSLGPKLEAASLLLIAHLYLLISVVKESEV